MKSSTKRSNDGEGAQVRRFKNLSLQAADARDGQTIGGNVGQAFSYAHSAVVQHKPLGTNQSGWMSGQESQWMDFGHGMTGMTGLKLQASAGS